MIPRGNPRGSSPTWCPKEATRCPPEDTSAPSTNGIRPRRARPMKGARRPRPAPYRCSRANPRGASRTRRPPRL